MSDSTNPPTLIGGHAEYVKGAVEVSTKTRHLKYTSDTLYQGAVGAVTGSEAWKDSAEKDKKQGIDDMKTASQNRDPATDGMGKAEEVLGKVSGCEGMEKEGAASKTTQ